MRTARVRRQTLKTTLTTLCIVGALAGCDAITRHKIVSTIFDGVPTLPPPEQICTEYAEKRVADARDEFTGKKSEAAEAAGAEASSHPPYDEKKCDRCHDKGTASGFVRPLNELCLTCHKGFLTHSFQHGPAAVGDCVECHDGHSSNFSSLLKTSKRTICDKCHREKRSAPGLHAKATERKFICIACHDPHDGDNRFFLK